MAEKVTPIEDILFDANPWPKLPAAEYFFFLFLGENGDTNCVTVHKILRPEYFQTNKAEVFTWSQDNPYVFKSTVLAKYGENSYKVTGDVNLDFKKIGSWYQVKGDKIGNKAGGGHENEFNYIMDLGTEQKTFKFHPLSLVKIYQNGLKLIHHLDVASSFGFLYSIFGTYKNPDNNSKGKFYMERLRLNTSRIEAPFWKLYDILFDDGSFFSFWDSPVYSSTRGLYIDRKDNTYRLLPNAAISSGPNWRSIKCWDNKNDELEASAITGNVYQTGFKRGLFGMNYYQTVGKLDKFSINGEVIDKSGIVYCDETGW